MPSAPSRASLNIRPMAFRGFDIVSPVFCKSRLASSEIVWAGVDRERGWADSSPACGDRLAWLSPRSLNTTCGMAGELESESGKA